MSLPATDLDPPSAAPTPRHRWLVAVGWVIAAGFCTGGAWTLALLAVRALFGIAFPPAQPRPDLSLVLIGSGAIFGLLAGVGLAFRSGSGERGMALPALGIGGPLFGALA